MDKLDSMRVFVAVARAGGFSAASRALGLPVATVSRKVADLEESLGVRLFERSTRQVVLTDVARDYYESCQRLIDDLRDADDTVMGEYRLPKGELTVTAPSGFGRQHLQPVLIDFMREFPQVTMRVLLVDRLVDLLDEHVDVAVRINNLPDSSLVARRVGEIRMVVCASPAYLQAKGVPAHPADLSEHDCISWASLGPQKAWLFSESGVETLFPVPIRLTATLPDMVVAAAVADLGLAQVASYQAEAAVRAEQLLPVLRDFESAATAVHLVHPSNRRVPLKLRVFLDYAAPRLQERLQGVAQAF
jgi:DNA-binding transcriptional LysR family regulator